MLRPIAIATLVAGTLDILFAMILTLVYGREIGAMLRYVASGPFPAATGLGAIGATLGLLVHFALIAVMAALFVIAAREQPRLVERPILSGLLYGIATYVVMNWVVVPVRYDAPLLPSATAVATQLFAHIVLVGLPIALITRRFGPAAGAART